MIKRIKDAIRNDELIDKLLEEMFKPAPKASNYVTTENYKGNRKGQRKE